MYSRVPSWTSSLGEKPILVSPAAFCQPPSCTSRLRLQDRRLQPLDHPFAHQLLSFSRRLELPPLAPLAGRSRVSAPNGDLRSRPFQARTTESNRLARAMRRSTCVFS
jgi:hypothetical protein